MSKFYQLRLLLWKNYLTKRRMPLILFLELFIPFVLFIVLAFVRHNNPALPQKTELYSAFAFPSSGLLTTAQVLVCDGSPGWQNGSNGLPEISPHSNLSSFLTKINRIFTKVSYLYPSDDNLGYADGMPQKFDKNLDTLDELASSFQIKSQNLSSPYKAVFTAYSLSSKGSVANDSLATDPEANGADLLTFQSILNSLETDSIEADIKELIEITEFLDDLSEIAQSLALDSCQVDEDGTKQGESTISNHSRHNSYDGLLALLEALTPVLCETKRSNETTKTTTTTTPASVENSTESQNKSEEFTDSFDAFGRDFRGYLPILTKIFTHNPKVLYSPANSSADLVFRKLNQTFAFIDEISSIARHWLLNTTIELHRYFEKPETNEKIQKIKTFQNLLLRESDNSPNSTTFKDFQPILDYKLENSSQIIAKLDIVDSAACTWLHRVSSANLSLFLPFANEYSAIDYSMTQARKDNVTVFAIVAFEVNSSDGSLLPHTKYKIRMNSSFLPSVRKIRPIYWSPIPSTWDYFYYFSGFSFIQDAIDRAVIDLQVGTDIYEPGTFAANVPTPCYLKDTFLFMNSIILPLSMAISFIYSTAILVQNIVSEKEYRLKEFMKVMGLSNAMHASAWFVTSFVQLTLCMTGITLLLRYGQVLLHSNTLIIWLLVELYAVATIAFSFLISSLFSNAKIASAAGGMLYFLSYVPAMCVGVREDIAGGDIPIFLKHVASLFSASALGLSFKYISLREAAGVGVQWDNLFDSPIERDQFSLAYAFGYLLLDTVIYVFLAWYIEMVHPGRYGIPKPWYFLFMKSHWTGQFSEEGWETPAVFQFFKLWFYRLIGRFPTENYDRFSHEESNTETNNRRPNFESEPLGLTLGVELDHLTKVYRQTGKVAVSDLSLKLYESQITGLLGHNGAGKSSTMSVLTGILPPSSGSVRIYGMDITTKLDVIRTSLGFCPQHDVLFEHLTPEEHLQFYSGLKRRAACADDDVGNMLKEVGLAVKKSTPVNHLSGGMKRKLSIALAFIGQSRLVVLDEPTAGVDPYSRRAIWDLITRHRSGRTILLSTHHMDEADVLADRISIISNGQLKCHGSSIFLKNTFCVGYHLVCVKASQSSFDTAIAFVRSALPSSYLFSESRQELHFILPYANQDAFPGFFKRLNSSLQFLGIVSFGVYDSTLEESFLRITQTAQKEEVETFVQKHRKCTSDTGSIATEPGYRRKSHRRQASAMSEIVLQGPTQRRGHRRQQSADSVLFKSNVESSSIMQNHQDSSSILSAGKGYVAPSGHERLIKDKEATSRWGRPPLLQVKQFRALFIKRLHYVKRNWKILFSQTFLPAIFVSIAMSLSLSAPNMGDPPPLLLSPAMFFNLTQPRGLFTPITNHAANYSDSGDRVTPKGWTDATANEIEETIYLVSGLSAKCTVRSVNNYISSEDNISTTLWKLSEDCQSIVQRIGVADYLANKAYSYSGNSSVGPYYPPCQCAADGSGFVCSSKYNRPPIHRLAAGDYIVDLDNQNLTAHWLNTEKVYRRHRYGGLTFGNELVHIPPEFGNNSASRLRVLAVRKVVLFNFEHRGYHTLPAYLNAVNNAILRANINKKPQLGNPAAYGISTYNDPMNGTDRVDSQELKVQGTDLSISVFVIIAMSFVPSSFVIFLVYERVSLVKHAQMMAGLHPVTYWLANYVWDLMNYVIPAICSIVVLVIFNVPAYVEGDNMTAMVLLFLLYGWSMTPMIYPTSWYFQDPSKGYVILVVVNLFVGTTCLLTSFLLDMFHSTQAFVILDYYVKVIFLIFPPFAMGRGIMDIAINHYRNEYYLISAQYDLMKSPLNWEITIRNLVVMFVEAFLFFGLTILLEYLPRFRCTCGAESTKRRSWTPPSNESEDDADVVAERHRILSGSTGKDLLVMDGLSKEFSSNSGRLLALDRLTLGLPPGECFGLLGLNGAGKSTTFSMLSGVRKSTAGEARLGNRMLSSQWVPENDVLKLVGYCPQTDPLLEELTAREHLALYARIRGISAEEEKRIVAWLIERMGLEFFADKPSGTYSGGTKRKLSAALALIGDPALVLLDEPTTGMDPGSRRFLWNLIMEMRNEDRVVVLTSHSMEECEVLCSRLGIMVSGKLQCLGSTQQLKDKFSSGYSIAVRLGGKSTTAVSNINTVELMCKAFEKAGIDSKSWRFVAQRHQIVELAILDSKPNLSVIFAMLNRLKHEREIVDFSLSQNTLDSVFLRLANGANIQQPSNSNSGLFSSLIGGGSGRIDPSRVTWGEDEDSYSHQSNSFELT